LRLTAPSSVEPLHVARIGNGCGLEVEPPLERLAPVDQAFRQAAPRTQHRNARGAYIRETSILDAELLEVHEPLLRFDDGLGKRTGADCQMECDGNCQGRRWLKDRESFLT